MVKVRFLLPMDPIVDCFREGATTPAETAARIVYMREDTFGTSPPDNVGTRISRDPFRTFAPIGDSSVPVNVVDPVMKAVQQILEEVALDGEMVFPCGTGFANFITPARICPYILIRNFFRFL